MNIIIITGTTNGLGSMIYKKLLDTNKYIVITINRSPLNKYNLNHFNIKLDLSNVNEVKKLNFDFILKMKKSNLIFINNAFSHSIGNIIDLEPQEIEKIINTNIISPLILINKISSLNLKKIINITSGVINKNIKGWGLYCSSKTFMELILKNINLERNIKIINFNPGVFDSNIQEKLRNSNLENKNYFQKLNLIDLNIICDNLLKEI